MEFEKIVYSLAEYSVLILDLLGIITSLIGALKCVILLIKDKLNYLKKEPLLIFANALALAMEFKLGSEIIKTMMVKSLDEILTLASVVAIKIVLSLVIHMEIKNAQERGENLHIEHPKLRSGLAKFKVSSLQSHKEENVNNK